MASTTTPPADQQEPEAAAAAPETTAAAKPKGVLGNPDFVKLWAGQSLSLFGTQVTLLAMPVIAVFMLSASEAQMGYLGALARAPFVLFLFAGVWADRVRRRPTMIWTDLGRGVLLALIPLLAFADALRIEYLYVIVFAVGVLGVFFEVANQAYLPSLVGREHIPDGNAKLQISNSVAQAGGPSVAGLLITFFSAATVVIIDAVSYFASAIACMFIRKPEDKPGGEGQQPKVFAAIGHGLKWVWTQAVLRPMVIATAFFMTFATGIQALYVFYLAELGVPKGWIGVVLAATGAGAIIGSTLSMKALRTIGPGPAALWSTVVCNGAFLLVPLAAGPVWLVVTIMIVSQFLIGLSTPISMVGMGSLRQVLTPNDMQGRVVATFRGLSLGLAPIGALAAGLLSEYVISLHLTLWIFAIGVLIPIAVIALSPIPGIKKFPAPPGA